MSPDDEDDLSPRPLLRPLPPPPPKEPRPASRPSLLQGDDGDPARPPPSRSTLPPPSAPLLASRRSVHVLGVMGVAVAFVGFFTGIAQERDETKRYEPPETVATAPAPGYKQLRAERRGPNAKLYEGAFERLGVVLPTPRDEVPPQSEEDRARVLANRSAIRAYDGAPPTIPHAIEGRSTYECLVCHEKGAVVAGKRAPAMSHERHDSCTQCHVAAGGPPHDHPPPLTSSTFTGAAPAPGGSRAWPGAPPVIPHTTWMRSRCTSCHGVAGALGMRSTHPYRESCQQCHVPSATLDQRAPRLAPTSTRPPENPTHEP